jgi:lysozyme family protein
MGAQQPNIYQQLMNPAAAQYQAAQYGLPMGASFDGSAPSRLDKLANIAGMLGQFTAGVNQAEKGTPGILMGLGNVSTAYNAQKYNQYQMALGQKQKALEDQKRFENQEQVNELRRVQGLPPITPYTMNGDNTGMMTTPEEYMKQLQYMGGVLGNQTEQRYTQGQGFTPQAGAVVDSAFMAILHKQAKENADNIETAARMPQAAKDGYAGPGNVRVPGVSVPEGGVPAGAGTTSPIAGDAFGRALNMTSALEGGYANNPSDKGGATNRGITQGTYDGWRRANGLRPQPVRNLSQAEFQTIYQNEYWKGSGADRLAESNPGLAMVHYDTAVNMGKGRAAELLKQAGGDVNKYLQLREAKYRQFAKEPSQQQFLNGWLNRNARLRQEIGGLAGATPIQATTTPTGAAPAMAQGATSLPAETLALNPNPQFFSNLLAYNTSPELKRQALIDDPYGTGIPDLAQLQNTFNAGASVRNNDLGAMTGRMNANTQAQTSANNAQLQANTQMATQQMQEAGANQRSDANNATQLQVANQQEAGATARQNAANERAEQQAQNNEANRILAERKAMIASIDSQLNSLRTAIPKAKKDERKEYQEQYQFLMKQRTRVQNGQPLEESPQSTSLYDQYATANKKWNSNTLRYE